MLFSKLDSTIENYTILVSIYSDTTKAIGPPQRTGTQNNLCMRKNTLSKSPSIKMSTNKHEP